MCDLADAIRPRGSLAPSTSRASVCMLTRVARGSCVAPELATQTDAVLAWVAKHLQAPTTRRTTLAALVVFTGNDAYRTAGSPTLVSAAANRPTASQEDMQKGRTSDLVSGALGNALPPRRLKDWREMKIRAYDTKSDSYIDGRGVARCRAFKTVKTHGPQSLRLPPQLTKFLRWSPQLHLQHVERCALTRRPFAL
eukprot:gene10916-7764_t